jgi:DNA-3-methyladenine glycosylase II
MLITSITSQQVSLRSALAIRRRLVEAYGLPGDVAWRFPTAERLASVELPELRALGFSTSKAAYVLALARTDLDLAALAQAPEDEVRARLVMLPGIGEWTADWFLARHLGRPDAWPAGDLGLRKALGRFYLDGRDPTVAEARAFGERFGGQRNLAAQYLLLGLRVPA